MGNWGNLIHVPLVIAKVPLEMFQMQLVFLVVMIGRGSFLLKCNKTALPLARIKYSNWKSSCAKWKFYEEYLEMLIQWDK